MAHQDKTRRERVDEFCKRLGIRQVKEKGGQEFMWNGPPYHGCQDFKKKPKRNKKETPGQENAQPVSNEEPHVDEITRTVILKCVEYGNSNDASQIPLLFALYREWIDRSSAAKRLEGLHVLTTAIEQHRGSAILALMPFITAETEP
jgi:hypothetical protein